MSDEDLYLEKLKIAERLQAVESTLIGHTVEIKSAIEMMRQTLDRHSEEIWGNGHPGLKTNMDRLLQIKNFFGLFATALAGLVAKAIWDVFKKI